MQIIDIPTEQTTAATDVLIAVVALAGVSYLRRFRRRDPWKTGVWTWVLMLLGLSAALGAVIHGVKLSPDMRHALWQPLNLLLGFVRALFIVGVVLDWRGRWAARWVLPIVIVFAVLFFVFALVTGNEFTVFVLSGAVVLIFAFVVYAGLALCGRVRGSGMMATSMALSIAAGVIQASGSVSINVIYPLDHNGVFHLVQALAIGVLVVGVRAGLNEEAGHKV